MNARAVILAGCLVAFGFVACGKKAEEPKTGDSTTTQPMDTSAMHHDTTAAHVDSTAMHTDSTAAHIDSTAAHIDSTAAHADSSKKSGGTGTTTKGKKGGTHAEAKPTTPTNGSVTPSTPRTPSEGAAVGSQKR